MHRARFQSSRGLSWWWPGKQGGAPRPPARTAQQGRPRRACAPREGGGTSAPGKRATRRHASLGASRCHCCCRRLPPFALRARGPASLPTVRSPAASESPLAPAAPVAGAAPRTAALQSAAAAAAVAVAAAAAAQRAPLAPPSAAVALPHVAPSTATTALLLIRS